MKAAVILVALVIVMATVALYSYRSDPFPGLSVPVTQAPERTPVYKHLEHHLEPLRDIAGSADEIYRLVQTFELSRTSLSILLMRNGEEYSLRYQAVEGGFAFGPSDTTIILSEDEWDECTDRIKDLEFWGTPSLMKRLGTDGVTVVLEGFRDGRYHYISCGSPPETSALHRYCVRMTTIAQNRIGLK